MKTLILLLFGATFAITQADDGGDKADLQRMVAVDAATLSGLLVCSCGL